jgi:hypothetical protein
MAACTRPPEQRRSSKHWGEDAGGRALLGQSTTDGSSNKQKVKKNRESEREGEGDGVMGDGHSNSSSEEAVVMFLWRESERRGQER